jgi:signal transduction histidine kinase
LNLKKNASMPNIIRLATVLVEDPIGGYAADLEERVTNVTRTREALGLSRDQVDDITASMTSDAFDVAKYLDIDIGNVEELLIRANKEIWKTYLMVEHLFKERQELSAQLLREEREKGAIRSKNVAIATMSHYLNNATMAISGRAQIMQRQLQKDDREGLLDKLPQSIEVIERSINKIRAVLEEIKDISPIDDVEYYDMSQAMNLDERIATRMSKLSEDTGLVLPESADTR